jgi:hypothetical protein
MDCKCDVLHEVDVIKVEEDLHKVVIEDMKGREFQRLKHKARIENVRFLGGDN